MFSRCRKAASHISNTLIDNRNAFSRGSSIFNRTFAKVAVDPSTTSTSNTKPEPFPRIAKRLFQFESGNCIFVMQGKVCIHYRPPQSPLSCGSLVHWARLNALFWSKPCSLALAPNSPFRVKEPEYQGFKRIMLKMMLFYSKQSIFIRGANVVYARIVSQVDKPAIYDVFSLEKTFKTTFALLVLHMWLFLRHVKEEGKDGIEFNQYLYEIYSHDLELRVSKAGVNLLLLKWVKELEKIFYGNVIAYDNALRPEAKNDELANVIWRNVFSDDGSPASDPLAIAAAQAMARYARRELTCLSMTDKESLMTGNFMFTSLRNLLPNQGKPTE